MANTMETGNPPEPVAPEPTPEPVTDITAILRAAVREGIDQALTGWVGLDVADEVRSEYKGGGMTNLRAAIRRAVREELQDWSDEVRMNELRPSGTSE